jgi:hypothetical protein
MRESSPVGTNVVEVVLEGGPDSLPIELRTCRVSQETDRIKVLHGGYEHFEREPADAVTNGSVIFRWINQTRIAEWRPQIRRVVQNPGRWSRRSPGR